MSDSTPPSGGRSPLLAHTVVMAAGTTVSRLSGVIRSVLLASAIGITLRADLFSVANTIPNAIYILVAGGIFNAVLVPQLVRALQRDADGGAAYTNRLFTLAALFLAAITVLLVVAAPLLVDLVAPKYSAPELDAQRQSLINLMRYCLPQVFFYGMFVMVGQILNARQRFGPMMWAPIANNVIAIGVLVTYLIVYGQATGPELEAAFDSGPELLLGLGSTAGIVVQFLVLLPYLRSAGFTLRPRFDFRGGGLGHTLRLGLWTVLFVIVNQIAYFVVVRLASSGTAQAALDSSAEQGTGYTIYSQAFLIVMVPHSVITVSLATAVLPTLSAYAAADQRRDAARSLAEVVRTSLAVIVPFAALLPVIAPQIARLVWGNGAGRADYGLAVPTLSLFGIGLMFFTLHYVMLRGFYALEQTRQVFFIQCFVAATNIAVALVLVGRATPEQTAPALVIAYAASYAVGSALSYAVLRRELGGLETPRLIRFGVRLLIVTVVSTGVTVAVAWAWTRAAGGDLPTSVMGAAVRLGVLGLLDVALFLGLAQLLRLREVSDILATLTRRRSPAQS